MPNHLSGLWIRTYLKRLLCSLIFRFKKVRFTFRYFSKLKLSLLTNITTMSPTYFGSETKSPSIEPRKFEISVGKCRNNSEISNEKFWLTSWFILIVLWSKLIESIDLSCLTSRLTSFSSDAKRSISTSRAFNFSSACPMTLSFALSRVSTKDSYLYISPFIFACSAEQCASSSSFLRKSSMRDELTDYRSAIFWWSCSMRWLYS